MGGDCMTDKNKKKTTSKRKKSSIPKKCRKRSRNKRQHFDKLDFPYAATEFDCQLCEYYGGHYDDGSIRCLAKRCDMLKSFDDFTADEDDNGIDENEAEENEDYDDWGDEYDDLSDLFI